MAGVAVGDTWGRKQWNVAFTSPHLWPGVLVFTKVPQAIRLRPPIKHRQQTWLGSRRNTGKDSLGSGRHFPIFLSPSPSEWWVTLEWVDRPKDASLLGDRGWNLDRREGWAMWGEMNCDLLAPETLSSSSSHLGSNSWSSASLRSSNVVCSPYSLPEKLTSTLGGIWASHTKTIADEPYFHHLKRARIRGSL